MAPKRGPYATGTARRTQILEATEQLVREHGHEAVTMRAVAGAIGISDAALYHYFPTRDHLLVEVLRHRDARTARTVGEVCTVDDLLRIAAANERDGNAVKLVAAMITAAAAPDHPAHPYFRDKYRVLTDTIATGLAAPEPPDGRHRALATVLMAVTDGLQSRWLIEPGLDMLAHLRLTADALGVATPKF